MKLYLVLYKYICIYCIRIYVMGVRILGFLFIESWGVNYILLLVLLFNFNLLNLNLIIMVFYF